VRLQRHSGHDGKGSGQQRFDELHEFPLCDTQEKTVCLRAPPLIFIEAWTTENETSALKRSPLDSPDQMLRSRCKKYRRNDRSFHPVKSLKTAIGQDLTLPD
jgi:hypothetical protein